MAFLVDDESTLTAVGNRWYATKTMLTWFTGLLVLVGFLQVVVLFVQWRLIRRQDEHFTKSERAWILAELGWYEGGLHITGNTLQVDGLTTESTNVNIKLTCRNEGRSPAWIENIRGRIEIFSKFPISEAPKGSDLAFLGPMEPLGAGKERSRVLQFICSGHAKKGEHFSVYVLVEYRDIFGIRRETTLGYSVVPDGIGIYRQEALPERNRNT